MSDTTTENCRALAAILHRSYDEVDYLWRQGRVSFTNWRLYKKFWTWTAPRFSGTSNLTQAAYAEKLGWDAVFRKIERTKRLIEIIDRLGEGKTPWPVNVTPAPTTSRTIAYGHAATVQIFDEFADARPSIIAFATRLCHEYGKPGRPAMICIDADDQFYVAVAP
ncbi:hypothetical protein [Acidocella aminolytica]|uniref:Uncharacterized protein n=1 Tax=Acidocella aminolytica 101 = DSM 11237 TaxID=1120923 RepID=A0A0D6PF35_9PROT|nr:hypothetical protein [Acidocella aminolytica]GAN80360.1 hypothetical protein Aam_046_001 [Acidocella aminolytica 101 = DSM 11237]GBQ43077.1 hypothetical protein AA11237_3171 [Acidocella aminolytica 101 = DSM 11237]SHF60669.1 hypothetical protein SAMN02746095_03849 [Acidocella aminolytica 101 = DSM 11237]